MSADRNEFYLTPVALFDDYPSTPDGATNYERQEIKTSWHSAIGSPILRAGDAPPFRAGRKRHSCRQAGPCCCERTHSATGRGHRVCAAVCGVKARGPLDTESYHGLPVGPGTICPGCARAFKAR